MYWISKSIHLLERFRNRLLIFLVILGPGVITMIADNDAGGIATYAVTGSKYGFGLLWIFIILVPMAYYIQEMTVRLGAVTKRGLGEAIFDGFGPFWGWFSLFDLAIINWCTLVTEYIGMTAAMAIFGVPPVITYITVTAILMTVVLSGRYWTFEKITLLFCGFNFVYIPAAFWAMETGTAPAWGAVFKGFYSPDLPQGLTADLLFVIMANIGTTITPWQIFFQQSAVVDKGLDIKDIRFGKMDTLAGSVFTCLVAAFIVITTGAAFYYHNPPILVEDARQTAEAIVPLLPHREGVWARALFAIALGAAICSPTWANTVMPESLRHELDVGSPERALGMLKRNPKLVNSRSKEYEETPLHMAAHRGYSKLVRWLMRHHADVNATCYNGFKPLHLASGGEVAKILLRAGAKVNVRNTYGYTPMQYAAYEGGSDRLAVVAAIRASGEPLDILSAMMLGRRAEARRLIRAHPATARTINAGGCTALHQAAANGDTETAALLLKIGLNVDAVGDDEASSPEEGFTALTDAALRDQTKMVEFLLDHGADPNKALSFKANGATRYPGQPPFNPKIVKILNRYVEQRKKSS